MKLHEAPAGTILHARFTDGSSTASFERMDGMYGRLKTEHGENASCYGTCELIPRADGTYDIGEP
jgi:hypothetical protein